MRKGGNLKAQSRQYRRQPRPTNGRHRTRSSGRSEFVTQPSHKGATFAARAPVVVMRRKTIEEEAGVHFGTSGLCRDVRPSFTSPAPMTDQAALASSADTDRAARNAFDPRFYKTSRKKSLSTFAARPTVAVMAQKIHREEKSVHFRGSRPCSYVDLLENSPAPSRGRLRPSRGRRGKDCRLPPLQERAESSVLTKKLAGFGPLQRQVGR